jgi:hypothetical protein
MPNWTGFIAGVVTAAVLGGAGLGAYRLLSGPPSTELRWANKQEVTAQATDTFKQLLGKDTQQNWQTPTVSVYSTPYALPQPQPVTLKDLSDNGQAHAIDALFKVSGGPSAAWQQLMAAAISASGATQRTDPYRANRVLIATVLKGLDTLPGDRLLWSRVFIQPINFTFAGYTVAATDTRTIKIASVEDTTNTKLSIGGAVEGAAAGAGKPDVGQTIEKSQKTNADVTEDYENLGIDIQPSFLRIIRESAPGGDVAGNALIQLSMVTDPVMIWCAQPTGCARGGQPAPLINVPAVQVQDDPLVLLVTNFQDAGEASAPTLSVLPQSALPHCPLKANVWMLYELRKIKNGRQNTVEGLQEVELREDADNTHEVEVVPADDIAPAVWSIKVTDHADGTRPVADDAPDLMGKTDDATPRKLAFTDYLTASQLVHWLKLRMAAKNSNAPGLKMALYAAGSDQPLTSEKTLTPFKHVANDCEAASTVRP